VDEEEEETSVSSSDWFESDFSEDSSSAPWAGLVEMRSEASGQLLGVVFNCSCLFLGYF
jgi:hypothetical protein